MNSRGESSADLRDGPHFGDDHSSTFPLYFGCAVEVDPLSLVNAVAMHLLFIFYDEEYNRRVFKAG